MANFIVHEGYHMMNYQKKSEISAHELLVEKSKPESEKQEEIFVYSKVVEFFSKYYESLRPNARPHLRNAITEMIRWNEIQICKLKYDGARLPPRP